MSNAFLLGRQPVLDREEGLFAYEFVFHPMDPPDQTTMSEGGGGDAGQLMELLSGRDAQELLAERKGVIAIGYDLLMNDSLMALPGSRIILGLTQELPLTAPVIERCHRLKESGFTLALDNHRFRPELAELYRIVDIVRIDLQLTPADRLKVAVQQFCPHPVRLLAKKVESRDEFIHCRACGFELFQGFFFTKPTVHEKKKLDETTARLLRILNLIINDADVDVIVRTFQESPGLTYRLLLQANSAVIGARQEIESVRHAISLMGREQIRRWAQIELLGSNFSREQDTPLVEMATARAGFMEYLSKSHQLLRGFKDAADRAFLTGTLSMLGSIYNVSIEEVVTSVELSADVKMALLRRTGLFGDMLTFVEALERLDFLTAQGLLPTLKFSPAQILDAQRKSFIPKTGGVSAT